MLNIEGEFVMMDEAFVLDRSNSIQQDQVIVYEVNISINIHAYEEHKIWFLEHIVDMVNINRFIKAEIYHEMNMDPIDDNHMRVKNLTIRYLIKSFDQLKKYLELKSKEMRSQVQEKFKNNYTIKRRVFIMDKEIVNKSN